MRTATNEPKKLTPADRRALRLRILAISSDLPYEYADIAMKIDPSLNKQMVLFCKNCNQTDTYITVILERIAEENGKMKAKLTNKG